MEQEKFEQVHKMLDKLEDIKNSQESIIDKINHVITDLFENPDKQLEKSMEDVHQKASDNLDVLGEIIEEYELKVNKMENEG